MFLGISVRSQKVRPKSERLLTIGARLDQLAGRSVLLRLLVWLSGSWWCFGPASVLSTPLLLMWNLGKDFPQYFPSSQFFPALSHSIQKCRTGCSVRTSQTVRERCCSWWHSGLSRLCRLWTWIRCAFTLLCCSAVIIQPRFNQRWLQKVFVPTAELEECFQWQWRWKSAEQMFLQQPKQTALTSFALWPLQKHLKVWGGGG